MTNPTSKDQDPILGVSVYYLQQVFLSEVKAKEGLSQDSKIYEIENLRLEQHGVIRQKGALVKCPQDEELGASYVDCLSGEDHVGPANFMLSYGWEYTIGDIVDTLVSFCESEQRDTKRTYIWICCLCLNQHRIYQKKVNGIVTDLLEPFNRCVTTIGTVLAMMSPWDEPVYLTRVWCIYEFFTAHKNGCTVEIVMPPREKKRMIEAVCDVGKFFEALAKTNIENANASEQSDKIKIMNEVEKKIGKTRLNREVNEKLRKWTEGVLLETKNEKKSKILSLQSFGDLPSNEALEYAAMEYANLCDKVAAIIYEDGNSLQAIDIYKEALDNRLKYQGANHEDTLATRINIATILSNEGILEDASYELKGIMSTLADKCTFFMISGSMHCNRGDFDGALAQYRKAEDKVKPNSVAEAHLRMNVAIVMEQKGDYDFALSGYKHALDRFEKLFAPDHPMIAMALNNIGNIYSIKGDSDQAIKLLFKAREIRLKVIGKNHQDTATTLNYIGHAYYRQARMNDALRYFEEALSITKAITKEKYHFSTADHYNGLGLVHLQMKNVRKARNYFLKAQLIYERVLGNDHPSFAHALFNLGCTMEEEGDLKTAIRLYHEVEAIRRRVLGDNHYLTVETYNKKGAILERVGEFDRALKQYRKMITIHPMELQTKLLRSTAFVRIGEIYSKKGYLRDAIQSLQKAERIQNLLLGADDRNTMKTKKMINKLKEEVECEKSHCTDATDESSIISSNSTKRCNVLYCKI